MSYMVATTAWGQGADGEKDDLPLVARVAQDTQIHATVGESVSLEVFFDEPDDGRETSYQWFFEDGSKAAQPLTLNPTVNDPTLILTDLNMEHSGHYFCQIIVGEDTVVSPAYHVTVAEAIPVLAGPLWAAIIALTLAASAAHAVAKAPGERRSH